VQEQGRRHIAALRIDGAGVAVAYRKAHLGGEEAERFSPGAGPAVLAVDGWRLGLAICKDTGVTAHTEATARLGIDLYVAGLVHRPDEIGQQDARGRRIAAACRGYVAFASCAGPAGAGYEETAGQSAVWAADGRELARAGAAPGDLARARLT
jgi:predicted amidohydrolase